MHRCLQSTVFTLLGIICIVGSARAQGSIRVGMDGGLNFAKDYFSDNQSTYRVRTGVVAGGIIDLGISDLWHLQLEPRYIQSGRKESWVITGDDPTPLAIADLVFKLDYLEIPLLLEAKMGAANIKPVLFAGPNIGFLLSGKADWDGVDVRQFGFPQSSDVKDDYKSVNFSVDLGAGGEYRISEAISLLANVRFSSGLVHIRKEGLNINSSGIQILAGFLYDL